MPSRQLRRALVVAALVTLLASCSPDSKQTIKVVATDSTCRASPAKAKAGDIVIQADNQGKVVTEVYLYAAHDRPLGEVENVAPGKQGTFTVKAGGGKYEVACKPNQEGDGIRAALTVTGPHAKNVAKFDPATARDLPTLTVNVAVSDDVFARGLDDLVPFVGQVIAFHITNSSTGQPHGFAVAGPDDAALGDTGPIAAGQSADLSVRFAAAGKYSGYDSVGENRQRGLAEDFTVVK